jgi:hypothetical protein
MALIGAIIIPSTGRALDWHLVLDFSIADPSAPGGAIQSRLVLGIDPSATEGFNSPWDTVAAPSGGALNVTFPHPEYLSDLNYVAGSESLWRDIRGNSGATQSWQIDAASNRSGAITTLSWSYIPSSGICQRPILTLLDPMHEGALSLSGNGSYSFPSGVDPTRLIINLDPGSANPPPPPPIGLWSPRQGKDSILLSWSGQNGSGPLTYNIFRRTSGQASSVKINPLPITGLSFLDTSLAPGETYFYKLVAINMDGCSSGDSSEFSIVLN